MSASCGLLHTSRRTRTYLRGDYFFASGFQFVSSVIGAVALSYNVLMRKRPSRVRPYCRPGCASTPPPWMCVGKSTTGAPGASERGLGDGDRRRHHPAIRTEVVQLVSMAIENANAARRTRLSVAICFERVAEVRRRS